MEAKADVAEELKEGEEVTRAIIALLMHHVSAYIEQVIE